MLASFDTSTPWQSKPTMQSINFMVECGAEQIFLKSKPICILNVIEMYRNNLEGLLLYLYQRDNKCFFDDTVLMRMDKIPYPRQRRGSTLVFFFTYAWQSARTFGVLDYVLQ